MGTAGLQEDWELIDLSCSRLTHQEVFLEIFDMNRSLELYLFQDPAEITITKHGRRCSFATVLGGDGFPGGAATTNGVTA